MVDSRLSDERQQAPQTSHGGSPGASAGADAAWSSNKATRSRGVGAILSADGGALARAC